MTLTWPVVGAVLFAALLHAAWNVGIKAGSDKELDTALRALLAGAISLPLLLVAGGPPARAALPYVATSCVLHLGYYSALAGAYRYGEFGSTYPIMRGAAPLLVALASSALLLEVPRPLAWLGIAGVTLGVLTIGLTRATQSLHHGRALTFALANAGIIAAYTVVDGLGVRTAVKAGSSAWQYVLMLGVLNTLPYPALVLLRRGHSERTHLSAYVSGRWPVAALGALAGVAAYAIALWAMTRAPVASVAALRETSVLFAALLGSARLGEAFGPQRALGTLAIAAGVMALRLA